MSPNVIKAAMTLVLSWSLLASPANGASPVPHARAKNVVLFIGDGMGEAHRKSASLAAFGEAGRLAMDDMPSKGTLSTRSSDNPVTDSAAAATAMASGIRTNNGVIALDEQMARVPTILEIAVTAGKSAGLVTTSQVTHATPAAFAAHVENRKSMTEIARQMLASGVDVLLGGGEDEFLPRQETGCYPEPGERSDGRNLVAEAISANYLYVCDEAAFVQVEPAAGGKLIGLFADEGMVRPFRPSLAEMTRKAIGILSNNPQGFFLMVEAAQIDWASHDNDAEKAIADTLGLDEAVGVARKFAEEAGETLLIVTADHETGGMKVSLTPSGRPDEEGPYPMPNGGVFYVNWSTRRHTSLDVPVASQGPWSELLAGANDNTHVFKVMTSALAGE